MDIQKALSVVEKNNPNEAAIINQYLADQKKSIVELGTDRAFALRDSSGEIRAFKQNVTLSASNGGLVQPVPGGPYVVSAQGYEIWAGEAGANVIFPREVIVNNEKKQNPYVERDTNNNRILIIYARAIAFRHSSKGIPQVVDWTTTFDTPSYRMIDLLSKAKKFPQAFRLLPSDIEPNEILPDEVDPLERGNGAKIKSTWASYNFDESTKLWVNTAHDEVLQWYSQIINREKKAIDFAQTFARRNALKHLSGLQKVPGQEKRNGYKTDITPIDTWHIPVICWRPTNGSIIKWDAAQYANLQDRVSGMLNGDNSEFEGTRPQITSGSERVSDEVGFETIEKSTDPEDQTDNDHRNDEHEPVDVQLSHVETTTRQYTLAEQKIMQNYQVTKQEFPDEHEQACRELKIQGNPTPEQVIMIHNKINEIIDLR